MEPITWNEFEKIELRVGTIIGVQNFPEANQPAYKLTMDFGLEVGIKKSSARITNLYSQEDLLNKRIIGVVNFSPKQIGPFISEFLCSGFYREDGSVVLAVPDKEVPNGAKLG